MAVSEGASRQDDITWITMITTTSYVPGVVCLAQSLLLVKSKYPLTCLVSSTAIANQLQQAIATENLQNLRIEFLPTWDRDIPEDSEVFLDATRRILWKNEKSFIFLDADMICVANIDELFDLFTTSLSDTCWAVSNFRIKKGCFGTTNEKNFNAGLMVVSNPSAAIYSKVLETEGDRQQGWECNEEKVLNEIYKCRWKLLSPAFNMQKRCFKHAPSLWNKWISEMKVIHYVGGKPWQGEEELSKDWESNEEYKPLFDLWWKVRRNSITYEEGVCKNIPLATET